MEPTIKSNKGQSPKINAKFVRFSVFHESKKNIFVQRIEEKMFLTVEID